MDLGLGGRACVVTGASRGIGRETARQLCAEGAVVLLVARGEERARRGGRRGRRPAAQAGGRAEAWRSTSPPRTRASGCSRRRTSASGRSTSSSTTPAPPGGATSTRSPTRTGTPQCELNVMAPLRAMRAAAPAMAERGWGRIVNVCSTAGKRPSAAMPEYSVAKAAELSLSRLFADRYAAQRRPRQRDLPRPGRFRALDGARAACSTSRSELSGAGSREEALEAAGAETADRPPRRGRRDRRGDRLPLLRARLLRQRRRLVGRRRHRPGDHLTDLAELLLSPEEARRSRSAATPTPPSSCRSTAGPRNPA